MCSATDHQPVLCNVQQLKLAGLVHGGGQQELESLLDFGRLASRREAKGWRLGKRLMGVLFTSRAMNAKQSYRLFQLSGAANVTELSELPVVRDYYGPKRQKLYSGSSQAR
jgi:hypothetical protein